MTALGRARWLALLLPAVLMIGALGSQFFGGLFPCEMCHWQRWPHYTAIVLALCAFLVRGKGWQRFLIAFAALAILVSGLIGFYHAGVEYGVFKGFTHCALVTEGLPSLSTIAQAPIVSCNVPQWTLLGVSLAGFNALFSGLGGLLILALLRRSMR
ncbi:MAG: hypothetical protein RIS52_2536 [Pseudomonadota bacterium]|jgi:disulfide bond formation protein DsbB